MPLSKKRFLPQEEFMSRQEDTLPVKERNKMLKSLQSSRAELHASLSKSWDLKTKATLGEFFASEIPEKDAYHQDWINALASPEICLVTVEDIVRLHADDISSLPVPPLVKSLFRGICEQAKKDKDQREEVVLKSAARAAEFLGNQRDKQGEPFHPQSKASYFQDVLNYRLILTKEEMDLGVKIVASRIEAWCKAERVVIVGILTGAYIFVTDLCRALRRPYSVQFIKASSYESGQKQGQLKISDDIKASSFVAGDGQPKKVMLVDELLDNGKTLQELRLYFQDMLKATHQESDIITCCLFTKKRDRDFPEADICGIPNLPDLWLIGMGLDDRQGKRGWSELFATPKVKLVETINRSEVDEMLTCLDDSARLTKTLKMGPLGLEITHQRPQLQIAALDGVQVNSKQHLLDLLQEYKEPIKGKFEQEVRLSFVCEGLPLVEEDEIFQGNELAYAEMRCKLRDQLFQDAAKAGVM
eukprot:gnl/MRDRNA2_/MRDRNA2_121265_c0_seq1.p1 gnl/MRDRNA2_/MRDRNA2_121265_c0~~gnl/MRDRNA2_/MRDRNA2_121265_c0_seq1.p1  ORF type:complete len:473 (+),score=118.69 gnl/MRDRNA2_/MRDRNA2_121265_c0_seq1:72-1490(+)